MEKKAFKAALIGIVIFLWGTAAAAYVLPGQAVLHYYVKSLGKEKGLFLQQEVHIRTGTPLEETRIVQETVYYRFPGAFRSEAVFGTARRVHLQVNGQALTVLDGRRVSPGQDRFDRYKDLILCRTRGQLERLLSRHGIRYEVCSLGRFEDSVVYVIGARYPDDAASRLVIDKTHFWPVRWIFPAAAGASAQDRLEIRYENWARIESAWYPWRVTFYQNGELARIIKVQSLEVDPPLPDALFDMARLKAMTAPASPPETALENDAAETDEIKKTIEEFKKIYN